MSGGNEHPMIGMLRRVCEKVGHDWSERDRRGRQACYRCLVRRGQ